MPSLDKAGAVLEAWYPGQQGGPAIADILTGAIDPSGHLPVSFPASKADLPHPKIQGDPLGAPIGPVGRGGRYGRFYTADYSEGALVGYKWFFAHGKRPLFSLWLRPLLHKILAFAALPPMPMATPSPRRPPSKMSATGPARRLHRSICRGPPRGSCEPLRLAGFRRVDLAPGEARKVEVAIDPRLLATFDEPARRWRIKKGVYTISAGFDAERRDLTAEALLPSAELPP